MEKDKILKEAVKIIREHLDKSYKIFLFGSWAKRNAVETSDLDIGILGKKKAPWNTMVVIRRKIESIPTLRKIDVVDFKTSEPSFKKNALKSAKFF